MVELRNIVKKYGQFEALKNISFKIDKGDIVGLLGPNGAGKTTAMRIITGYMPATSGEVLINDIPFETNYKEMKKLIGYLPEHPPLYHELKIYEYLKFTAEIKNVKKENIEKRIDYVLNACELQDRKNQLISGLSKGYKQRVGLAMAIINDPDLLVLDEPTVGLDPNQIIEIRKLIKELSKDRTIILSTHILPEVSETCEKVIIINEGQLILQDTTKNLLNISSGEKKVTVKVKSDISNVKTFLNNFDNINEININESENELSFLTNDDEKVKIELSKKIINNNMDLIEIKTDNKSLENIFHSLTIKE